MEVWEPPLRSRGPLSRNGSWFFGEAVCTGTETATGTGTACLGPVARIREYFYNDQSPLSFTPKNQISTASDP